MLCAAKEETSVWPAIWGESVLPLAADPALLENRIGPKSQLAENSRQRFQLRSSTLRWASSEVKSRTALGMRGTLYDERIGSRCTGKERDSESGLDMFGARYYASTMGRFITPDSISYSGLNDPQSLNFYSYVGNHPLSFVDPDGHCWKSFNWICNIGQRFANLADGEGFRTDQQIDSTPPAKDPRNLRRRSQELQGQKPSTAMWVQSIGNRIVNGGNALGPGGREEIRQYCAGALASSVCYDMWSHFGPLMPGGDRPFFAGVMVYRVWGNKSGPYGKYWTRVDPRTVPNYRDAAGLPNTNSGRFITRGDLNNMDGVNKTTARPLDGNQGGLDELEVQNPEGQISNQFIEVLPPGAEF